jgi:DNA topoisomerase-2
VKPVQKSAVTTATGVRDSVKPRAATATSAENLLDELYQRKTPIEHVLLRPDSYVGSTEIQSTHAWVLAKSRSSAASPSITLEQIEYVPALYKIFDEILVNALDNRQRDATTTQLDITVDTAQNSISIFNNGAGIPVVRHSKEQLWIPELVMGHLLTGSNFDDAVGKVTGGRNGYGAKLANIFSKSFTVETLDSKRGLRYAQTWHDNMKRADAPIIDKAPPGATYVAHSWRSNMLMCAQ